MKRWVRYIVVVVLFGLLIVIRAFQTNFFYDPLEIYYKNDYLYMPLPDVNHIKLFFSYFIRYFINSMISFAILKIAFSGRSFIRTIVLFYILAFILLSSVLFGLIVFKIDVGYLFPFYLRRFMIHPVFIIVLLPFIYLMKKRYRLNVK